MSLHPTNTKGIICLLKLSSMVNESESIKIYWHISFLSLENSP